VYITPERLDEREKMGIRAHSMFNIEPLQATLVGL
jgi:hypothetical protein